MTLAWEPLAMALFLAVMGGWAFYRALNASTSELQSEEAERMRRAHSEGARWPRPRLATRADAYLSRFWLFTGGLAALLAAAWCVRLAVIAQ